MLEDHRGPLGHVLWRAATDVLLWQSATGTRSALFHSPPVEDEGELLAYATSEAPELAESLQVLWDVHHSPELADAAAVAEACTRIALWGERRATKRTAVQFAELAARVHADSSSCSFTAGRLCRRDGEHQRAAIWYRRALRQGRLASNLIDVANAQLGLGNLQSDLGNVAKAEQHFLRAARAALRNGRRSLAAAAFHNLVGVAYDGGRKAEAMEHLGKAAAYYGADHPRFPAFAYDAGFFLMREGYFSSALVVFETLLPWVDGQRLSVLVRSALARSAAAVRDHIRYQRQAAAVLALVAADTENSANALYQLAEGARAFQDWERGRELATAALHLARQRGDATVAGHAVRLQEALNARMPGDSDRVPPEGDEVDAITQFVLRKLKKRPAPGADGGAVPPEGYPTG